MCLFLEMTSDVQEFPTTHNLKDRRYQDWKNLVVTCTVTQELCSMENKIKVKVQQLSIFYLVDETKYVSFEWHFCQIGQLLIRYGMYIGIFIYMCASAYMCIHICIHFLKIRWKSLWNWLHKDKCFQPQADLLLLIFEA